MSTRFWGVTADQYRGVLGDRLSPAMKHSLVRLTEYEHDESYVLAFGFTRTQLNTCWGFGTELLGGSRQNTKWGNIQRFVESMARHVDAIPVTPCDDSRWPRGSFTYIYLIKCDLEQLHVKNPPIMSKHARLPATGSLTEQYHIYWFIPKPLLLDITVLMREVCP